MLCRRLRHDGESNEEKTMGGIAHNEVFAAFDTGKYIGNRSHLFCVLQSEE